MLNERIYDAQTAAHRIRQFARDESAWLHRDAYAKLLGYYGREIIFQEASNRNDEWMLVRRMSDREVQVMAELDRHGMYEMRRQEYERQMRMYLPVNLWTDLEWEMH